MFGIDNPRPPDPDSLEEQLKQCIERAQRELDIAQARSFIDAICEDEPDNLPARDESRIDLSAPKTWHDGIDLLRHLAELGDRTEANKISQVLARAFDAEKSIHHCSGGTWALVLVSMVERAVLTAKDMPQPPKN